MNTEHANKLWNSLIRNILYVKRLSPFKMQLNKCMEEKPLRDVQFQDTTTGSVGLISKVSKVRNYSGKVSPFFLGTFRTRIKTVSSRRLIWLCMAILVGLGVFVHGEIIQYGCYPIGVNLAHLLTKRLLIRLQGVCTHGLFLDTAVTKQLLLDMPTAILCCLLFTSNRVSLVQQLSIFCD